MSITGPRTGAVGRIVRGALDVVLPAACLGCGGPATGAGHLGLCLACRGRLKRPAPGCGICGEPIPAAGLAPSPADPVCGRCRRRPPAFLALRAPWAYVGPLTEVVRALKFRRLDYLGRHLARDLREMLAAGGETWDLVVPVPLHWRRRWARGYNQAERIARPLAALLGVRCEEALRRRRATRPQTGLPREERLANLREAFVPRRPLGARRVLLVDDVVTTGATLGAAAHALRRAGAREVLALAAARTPEEA